LVVEAILCVIILSWARTRFGVGAGAGVGEQGLGVGVIRQARDTANQRGVNHDSLVPFGRFDDEGFASRYRLARYTHTVITCGVLVVV
jgi:hypothetical protein